MTTRTAWRGKRVLITGGLGFIGSNLAHRLVGLGADVALVDSLHPECGGNWANLAGIRPRVRAETFDLAEMEKLAWMVAGRDAIFNLAGNVSHIDSMRAPLDDERANVTAHIALLETVRAINPAAKIVYAGTRQVYGKPQYLPVDEKHPAHPTDVNGAHKLAAEHLHLVYARAHGLHATILRLTNTYGPRMLMRHNRQGFIAWFVRQALDGETIKLFGGGGQTRDLDYVDDVVNAFLLAAAGEQTSGEVYNLGGGEPVTLKAIAQLLCELCPQAKLRSVPFPAEKKAIDIGDYRADASKFRAATGWRAKTPLRTGLERMVAYYTKHKADYWGECEQ
ncbi:MAG: NAD-dependent epimerase/dehydratase family protein [Chloroflexi bacterium]|nr:NAD-dependent epimerase/dehydratase family protein [Chloroflexota bacterium]